MGSDAAPAQSPRAVLRFAYRSHLDDTIPVATAALALRVHAGIALRIPPHVTNVGHSIFFSGTLHGARSLLGRNSGLRSQASLVGSGSNPTLSAPARRAATAFLYRFYSPVFVTTAFVSSRQDSRWISHLWGWRLVLVVDVHVSAEPQHGHAGSIWPWPRCFCNCSSWDRER